MKPRTAGMGAHPDYFTPYMVSYHGNIEATCWKSGTAFKYRGKGTEGHLPTTLANHARRAQEDSQDVAKRAQGNKEVETLDRVAAAKDALEEKGGGDLLGLCQVALGNGGKVCDVGKDVQDRHYNESDETVSSDLFDRVLFQSQYLFV